jgi:hypothetical protein
VQAQAVLLLLGPALFDKLEQLTHTPLMIELVVGLHVHFKELEFHKKVATQSQVLLVTVPST